eukprot:COSAG05_NODE_2408_length_3098_cov_7.489830_3_plen_204_part_00
MIIIHTLIDALIRTRPLDVGHLGCSAVGVADNHSCGVGCATLIMGAGGGGAIAGAGLAHAFCLHGKLLWNATCADARCSPNRSIAIDRTRSINRIGGGGGRKRNSPPRVGASRQPQTGGKVRRGDERWDVHDLVKSTWMPHGYARGIQDRYGAVGGDFGGILCANGGACGLVNASGPDHPQVTKPPQVIVPTVCSKQSFEVSV